MRVITGFAKKKPLCFFIVQFKFKITKKTQ